jgi:hypothetical protein
MYTAKDENPSSKFILKKVSGVLSSNPFFLTIFFAESCNEEETAVPRCYCNWLFLNYFIRYVWA